MNSHRLPIKNITSAWYFIPLILLCLAIIFFPLKGVNLSADSGWYLEKAADIYYHLNLKSFLMRRPVLPFLLAGSFHIFGYGIKSAFYIIRVFFVLNILLSYFVGTKFFNRATGLTFSLFIFTSSVINTWSSGLSLDNILPFFLLLFILLVYLAFERCQYLYFILAGITLGVGLLAKPEITIVFIPLAICVLIFKKYRTIKHIKGLALLYLSFFTLITPHILLIIFWHQAPQILLGPALGNFNKIQGTGLIPQISQPVWKIFFKEITYIKDFIDKYIAQKFILSSLFLLGILYSFYQAIFKKHRESALLLIAVLLFLPISFTISKLSLRVGQAIIFYFLLYLLAANLLVNLPKEIVARPFFKSKVNENKKRFVKTLSILVILLCLFFQIFIGQGKAKTFYKLTRGQEINTFSFWQGEFILDGWANKAVRDTAEWIKTNIPQGTEILCPWHYRSSINFITQHKYTLPNIEFTALAPQAKKLRPDELASQPLFVWTANGGHQLVGNYFYILFESNLLQPINDNQISYVLVTLRRNFLSLYFDNNANFSLVKSFNNGEIKIYQVNYLPIQAKDSFSTKFDEQVYIYLNQLYQKMPLKYEEEKQKLKQALSWTDIEADRFFSFIENNNIQDFWRNYEKVKKSEIIPLPESVK